MGTCIILVITCNYQPDNSSQASELPQDPSETENPRFWPKAAIFVPTKLFFVSCGSWNWGEINFICCKLVKVGRSKISNCHGNQKLRLISVDNKCWNGNLSDTVTPRWSTQAVLDSWNLGSIQGNQIVPTKLMRFVLASIIWMVYKLVFTNLRIQVFLKPLVVACAAKIYPLTLEFTCKYRVF